MTQEGLSEQRMKQLLPVLLAAARQATQDPHLAQEAAHVAVLKLDERLRRGDAPKHELGWAKSVAHNHALKEGERAARQVPFGRQGSLPPRQGDEGDDRAVAQRIAEAGRDRNRTPSTQVVDDESVAEIAAALLALDPDELWLLEQKYMERRRTRAIAEELGLAPGTVDNRLTRAKQHARQELGDLADELFA